MALDLTRVLDTFNIGRSLGGGGGKFWRPASKTVAVVRVFTCWSPVTGREELNKIIGYHGRGAGQQPALCEKTPAWDGRQAADCAECSRDATVAQQGDGAGKRSVKHGVNLVVLEENGQRATELKMTLCEMTASVFQDIAKVMKTYKGERVFGCDGIDFVIDYDKTRAVKNMYITTARERGSVLLPPTLEAQCQDVMTVPEWNPTWARTIIPVGTVVRPVETRTVSTTPVAGGPPAVWTPPAAVAPVVPNTAPERPPNPANVKPTVVAPDMATKLAYELGGLPPGWTVRWIEQYDRFLYIPPNTPSSKGVWDRPPGSGPRGGVAALPDAALPPPPASPTPPQAPVGVQTAPVVPTPGQPPPAAFQDIPEDPAKMAAARIGLPEGWQVGWSKRGGKPVFASPQGKSQWEHPNPPKPAAPPAPPPVAAAPTIADPDSAPPFTPGPSTVPTTPEKPKRVRRTKEQIAADNAAKSASAGIPPPPPTAAAPQAGGAVPVVAATGVVPPGAPSCFALCEMSTDDQGKPVCDPTDTYCRACPAFGACVAEWKQKGIDVTAKAA